MKTANAKKSAKSFNPPAKSAAAASETGVRVVKSAQCPSLSGKSDLAYEFGVAVDGALRLRITGNTGKGSFRQEWVDVGALRAALDKPPRSETITSDCLMALFRKESANMPSFVFAVLMREGVVRPSATSKRRYDRAEPAAIDAVVKSLAEGKGAASASNRKGGKPSAAKVDITKSKKGNKSSKGN